MKLSIDEAIQFCKEKSKNIKLKAEPQVFVEIAEKLEELKICKDLEEQGLLVKLPCKIGDTVYFIENNHIDKMIVYQFDMRPLQNFACDYIDKRINFKYFGKTVFLTKEKAEQALERINNKNEM